MAARCRVESEANQVQTSARLSPLSRSRSERERCSHQSSKGGSHQEMGTSQGWEILTGISRNSRILRQYLLEVATVAKPLTQLVSR